MASWAARAARNNEARTRLEESLERVARRLGVEIPPPAKRSFDPDLTPILEVERFATFVEAVDQKLEGLAQGQEVPEGREAWTMDMLRAYAKEQDIKIPGDVKKKVDIAAYIETVEAERKASDEAGEGGAEGDSSESPAVDEAAGEEQAPSPAEGSGELAPGTGTVRVNEDGTQTVVEPREGSDQRPGDQAGKAPSAEDKR